MAGYKELHESALSLIEELEGREGGDVREAFLRRLAALKARLLSDRFHIVVMGQFKRGKTTFINSLLGARILPSSVVPLTSVNTVLRYGEEVRAEVHYLDGRTEEIGLERIPAFVTEKENPENRLGVKRVEVSYPSRYLKDGVCLVDTPGTGSTYLHNDETAYSYLENADAVVFMVSADPPVSRSELDFLHRIRKHVRKVFFVQNKVDYLEEEDREESLTFNRQVISRALDLDEVKIHPLSARQALEAQLRGDASSLEESGLPRFSAALESFLVNEKGWVFLETCIKNTQKLLGDEMAAMELEAGLLSHPLEDLKEKVEEFHRQMEVIAREREEIRYLIEGDRRHLVTEVLDADVEAFKARATDPLLHRYHSFFEENKHLSGAELAAALGGFIQEEIRETFSEWRSVEEERLSEQFKLMERRYRDRANSISNRILEIAGHLFGISLPTLEAELDLSEEGEFWFHLGDPPSDLEMIIGTVVRSLPRKLSHRLLRKSKQEDLLMLFDRHCGRVRYDFYLRLQKSVNSLVCAVDEVIGETLDTIEAGIARAVEQLNTEGRDIEAALAGLRERRERLHSARVRLERLLAPPSSS